MNEQMKIYIEKYPKEIADMFNTTEDNLKQINGIMDNYMLSKGNFIIVPIMEKSSNENFDIYRVKQGDSIYSIAQRYDVDYMDLLELNGLDKDQYIYVNQEIMVPKTGVDFIVVKENETLNNVLNSLNTTADELIRQNRTIYLMPDQLIVYKKRD